MYEFLAWVHDLVETRDRLAAEAEKKMKPARWASLVAMPFFVWLLLQALLNAGHLPLTTWLWVLPGMAIFGLCVLIENFVTARRDAYTALYARRGSKRQDFHEICVVLLMRSIVATPTMKWRAMARMDCPSLSMDLT